MGMLLIPNATFQVPMLSQRTPGLDWWGYTPIPITLDAVGCTFAANFGPHTATASFQLWVDGADIGAPIAVGDTGAQFVVFDDPVAIPAVDATNIDGAARFTMHAVMTPYESDDAMVVLRYAPTNVSDTGKHLLGFGDTNFAKVATVGAFAAITPPGESTGWGGSGTGPFFAGYEDNSPVTEGAKPPAGIVWPVAGTFQNFTLVTRAAGGPGGVYKIALRINKTDVMTITTAATSTRIWTQDGGPSPIPIADGDLVDWQLVSAPGTLDADLLYTFTSAGSTAQTGYGEGGYGEGGYGGG